MWAPSVRAARPAWEGTAAGLSPLGFKPVPAVFGCRFGCVHSLQRTFSDLLLLLLLLLDRPVTWAEFLKESAIYILAARPNSTAMHIRLPL